MQRPFDALTTPTPRGDGLFDIDVPDGWQQGRGAFGGLVLAYLVRAVEATLSDPSRVLRSLTGELVGPLQPGPATVRVEILRAGSGVTTTAARVIQGGEVQAHAVIASGAPRAPFEQAPVLPRPTPPPWRDVPGTPMGPPAAPVFTPHLELRLDGPLPFTGVASDTRGWVRLRHPGADRGSAYLVALADSLWPSLLNGISEPRPIATLAFSFQRVRGLDGLDPDAPLYYRGRVLAGSDGYAVEQRELWGEDGRLVALNEQTIVVIR